MQNRRVLVCANLKTQKLVGFPSAGMVMCAAITDKQTGEERVEFVEPPADAPLGEKIVFEGLDPEVKFTPWEPNKVSKKKVFANCVPDLNTDENCVGAWKNFKMMTSAGPCKAASISNGAVR